MLHKRVVRHIKLHPVYFNPICCINLKGKELKSSIKTRGNAHIQSHQIPQKAISKALFISTKKKVKTVSEKIIETF